MFAGHAVPVRVHHDRVRRARGFHSLVASGTTPKMVEKETRGRPIGYGAMLMESFVAVMALITASIIDPVSTTR